MRQPPTIEGLTIEELTEIPSNKAKILRHRLLRRSFEAWCTYRMAKFNRKPAEHHLLIIDTIDKLIHNQLDKRRVMILMPPGSAKSTYTSKELPAWFVNVDQFPTDLILGCSFSYELIEGFGKEARDAVALEKNVLGVTPSRSFWAAGDWRTERGGGFWCAGVTSGIAGHRGRLGLIDDYVGSEAEAVSEVARNNVWKWYWNDFLPRLWPDSWQFLIANRRHEDDLVGRLLNKCPNDWLVIKLPMLAQEDDPLGRAVGERLWPEWFTEKQVEDAKVEPSTWAGLYQQDPHPEDGDFFRKETILEYRPGDLPNDLRIYVGSDYAYRTKTKNDYTCFVPAGIDSNGNMWILPDWFWKKVDTLESVDVMLEMCRRRRPIVWFAGKENIVGSIEPFLNERMRKQNTYVAVEQLSESKDKLQKAQSIKARMAARAVMFPAFAPGWAEAKQQMLAFPNATHDDFVDALAKLGQGLDLMVKATKTEPSWDGIVPEERITCRWLEKSHRRREQARRVLMADF